MIKKLLLTRTPALLAALACLLLACSLAAAQQKETPLTSQELVKLIYQLPKQPEKKEEVIGEIRRRGLGFPLTDGMRSLAASKSGNDATLRRTLEEAERRRLNPTASQLPSEAEATAVLEKARVATLAAREMMPDFVVKQLVTRSFSRGGTNNWIFLDRLTIAVSYRAKVGEEYKVLAVNGLPPNKDAPAAGTYENQVGGSTSAGEFATTLAETFEPERGTEFKLLDTDTVRGRRALIFEYRVAYEPSKVHIRVLNQSSKVGYHGRLWIDRESNRVLRFEILTDPPQGFPGTASQLIGYDWVNIAEQQYLLPAEADSRITSTHRGELITSRILTRFRGYQKYGSEVKILEDDIIEDPPEEKP